MSKVNDGSKMLLRLVVNNSATPRAVEADDELLTLLHRNRLRLVKFEKRTGKPRNKECAYADDHWESSFTD